MEIQALWLNALAIGAKFSARWEKLFEKGRASFESKFWNEHAGYLADVIDCDHQPGVIDLTFRPNQIFAVGGLPLMLFLREWYMHPNGQIPAYEFAFGDVNPPVHAWAAWRVYKMTGPRGQRDTAFLESVFQKLLLNFTWWVNRKDAEGNHLFSGGFLGLDNVGVFDRSKPLPTGGFLQQADGTACLGEWLGAATTLAFCSSNVRTRLWR